MTMTALQDKPLSEGTDEKPTTLKPIDKRSKSRLRELAGEVDKLQDRLADHDDEVKAWNAQADGRRKDLKKQITHKVKDWNDEAAKRK